MFLERLEYSLGASATEHLHFEWSESQSLDGVKDAGEVRSIDEDAVLVTDVDNNAALAVIFTVANPSDSSCFDVVFKHLKTNKLR